MNSDAWDEIIVKTAPGEKPSSGLLCKFAGITTASTLNAGVCTVHMYA